LHAAKAKTLASSGNDMVSFGNFAELHPDARRLTEDLLQAANDRRHDPFYSFSLLWMSFNGWMSCVTEAERDAKMVDDLGTDPRLAGAFVDIRNGDAEFRALVQEFAECWPIFNSNHVRRRLGSAFAYKYASRADFVADLTGRKVGRRPLGWVAGQQPRWADLLSAIYQIRCNLFHGVKSPQNADDQQLVSMAFRSLTRFIRLSNCYSWQ
jgi:hypothetical protein